MNDFDLTAMIDRHNIKAIYRIKVMDSFSVTLASGNFGFGKSVSEALANAQKPSAQNMIWPAND